MRVAPFLIACGLLTACGAPTPNPPPVASPPPPVRPPPDVGALFAPPAVRDMQISPDGARAAWLVDADKAAVAALNPGVEAGASALGEPVEIPLNPGALAPAPPAEAPDRLSPDRLFWAQTNAHLLVISRLPDGAAVIRSVAAADGKAVDLLLPGERLASLSVGLSPAQPSTLMALVRRAGGRAQVLAIDVATGKRQLVDRNRNGFTAFYFDGLNRPRLARRSEGAAGDSLWRFERGAWGKLLDIPAADAARTQVAAVAADGQAALLLDRINRERTTLVSLSLQSGDKTVLGESRQADVTDAWIDPTTRTTQAFLAEYLRPVVTPLSQGAQEDFAALDAALEGDFQITSRSRDDSLWIVREASPVHPGVFYLYDRRARRTLRLAASRPQIDGVGLAPMRALEIASRDGQTLVAYLTIPTAADADNDGRSERPMPLALLVRDPGIDRDRFEFRPDHQWLASRGITALSVNYRGAVGLGAKFEALGAGSLGAGLQSDLEDALSWALEAGIAAPGRIAVFGEGLAGSAALTMLADPQRRANCAVAVDPVADLAGLDPARLTANPGWDRFIGAVRSADDSRRLAAASPLSRARDMAGAAVIVAKPTTPVTALASALRAANVTTQVAVLEPAAAPLSAPYSSSDSAFAAAAPFLQACLSAPGAGAPQSGAIRGGPIQGGAIQGGAIQGGAIQGGVVKGR